MSNNSLYEEWRHFVGIFNLKGEILTESMLREWAETDSRLECVFCGSIYDIDTRYCKRCHEYKGLQPYIVGWSDNG